MILSVALIAKHQMEGLLVNAELERIWKELVVVKFDVMSSHLSEGT